MKQKSSLEKLVQNKLRQGISKNNILTSLEKTHSRDELVYYLNILPGERQRRKYLWMNRFLCALLLILTLKKLYFIALVQVMAISSGQFSALLLLDLIVPVINFYILAKLIRFQRQGYQFMAILGALALIRPENQIMPDLALYLIVTGLAIFLLLRLFPKQQRLE